MIVKYIERYQIDKYRVMDVKKELRAQSYFINANGNLYYFKVNAFEYKCISKDFVKSIIE